jgi:Ribbon-helix-helix protein, copG family.
MDNPTDTFTIRMQKSQIDELKKISKRRNISLNTLVSQLFRHYLEIERVYDKFDWVKVSKSTLKVALKKFTNEEIEIIGKQIALEFAIDFILVKWGDVSEQNILEFIKIYFKENSWGNCKIFTESNGIIITIQHKMGKKASKLFSVIIETLFKNQLNKKSTTKLTDSIVSIFIQKILMKKYYL